MMKLKKLKINNKEMIIFDVNDDISDLKERNLLINKQKKEIEILKKQLNEYEEYFNNEEKKKELKKIIKIQDLNKK